MRTHVDKRADGVPLRALRVYKEPWAVNALVGLRLPALLAPLALPELVLHRRTEHFVVPQVKMCS